MQLLDVKFGPFPHAAPQDGTSELVDLQHVLLGIFFRQAKDLLENHRDITHQVYRIIVNDDLPRDVELFGGTRFLLHHRVFD